MIHSGCGSTTLRKWLATLNIPPPSDRCLKKREREAGMHIESCRKAQHDGGDAFRKTPFFWSPRHHHRRVHSHLPLLDRRQILVLKKRRPPRAPVFALVAKVIFQELCFVSAQLANRRTTTCARYKMSLVGYATVAMVLHVQVEMPLTCLS